MALCPEMPHSTGSRSKTQSEYGGWIILAGLEALAKRYDQPALKSSTGRQAAGQIKRGENQINAI